MLARSPARRAGGSEQTDVYVKPGQYLSRGDIFEEVPLVSYETTTVFPSYNVQPGPAMLIQGDCAIDKRAGTHFIFAPLLDIESVEKDKQDLVRRREVRRYFPLEADFALGSYEWMVDFEQVCPLPRSLFVIRFVKIDERQTRFEPLDNSGINRRVLSLDEEAQGLLREQFAGYFDLRESTPDAV